MAQTNKLTQKRLDSLKPGPEPYSVADGSGLALFVRPSGAFWWRYRYRFGGRAKMLSLGIYPDTTLKAARVKRAAARKLLAADIDPSVDRRERKAAQADSFSAMAAEWFIDANAGNVEVTRTRNRFILDRVCDRVGKRPISEITTLRPTDSVVGSKYSTFLNQNNSLRRPLSTGLFCTAAFNSHLSQNRKRFPSESIGLRVSISCSISPGFFVVFFRGGRGRVA